MENFWSFVDGVHHLTAVRMLWLNLEPFPSKAQQPPYRCAIQAACLKPIRGTGRVASFLSAFFTVDQKFLRVR
jgi:hypothetical protein